MAHFFDLVIEEFELELEIAILELEDEISELENEDIRTYNNTIQCNECLKVFSSVPILNFHIKLIHADNSKIESGEENAYVMKNPIQCVICHKIFSYTTTLEQHKNISHKTVKSGQEIPTGDYIIVLKQNHSKGHGDILRCERSLEDLCSIKNDTNFMDETLACDDRHLRTHIIIIIFAFQDFKIPNRVKMNISPKYEDQNFTFQVF